MCRAAYTSSLLNKKLNFNLQNSNKQIFQLIRFELIKSTKVHADAVVVALIM